MMTELKLLYYWNSTKDNCIPLEPVWIMDYATLDRVMSYAREHTAHRLHTLTSKKLNAIMMDWLTR